MFPTGYFIRVNKLFYPKQVKATTAHVFSRHILLLERYSTFALFDDARYLFSIKVIIICLQQRYPTFEDKAKRHLTAT